MEVTDNSSADEGASSSAESNVNQSQNKDKQEEMMDTSDKPITAQPDKKEEELGQKEDKSDAVKDNDEEKKKEAGCKQNTEGATEKPVEGASCGSNESADTVWICQYCDRAFTASDQLLRHEMQHLMGNRFSITSV